MHASCRGAARPYTRFSDKLVERYTFYWLGQKDKDKHGRTRRSPQGGTFLPAYCVHGTYTQWNSDGTIDEQGEYVDGLKQGTWTKHSSTSGRSWQEKYVDGREVR